MTIPAGRTSSMNSIAVERNSSKLNTFYRRWTPEEDTVLRAMWGEKKSQSIIAAALKRTSNMVAGRVTHLGLRTEGRHLYHRWTMGDRFTLKAMWKTEASVATIAKALNVSDRIVRREARKLKLSDRKVKVQREKKSRKRLLAAPKPAKGWHKGKLRDLPPEPTPAHGMFFLPRNKCQWIANKYVPNSGDLQKCGEQVVAGRPYCPGHEARVWRPREEKQAA